MLNNDEALNRAFSSSEGFSSSLMVTGPNPEGAGRTASDYEDTMSKHFHPMQGASSYFKEGFRIAPVQSNVLPYRILQVMSYPNVLKKPDNETIECLNYVSVAFKRHLNLDVGSDIVYAVRVVFHAIVTGNKDIHRILSRLETLENIPSLAGKYVGHKNPMDAIQLMTRTDSSLSHVFWNDMRVSQFNTNSYVVTIFNETDSLARGIEFIAGVKEFVVKMMSEIEEAVSTSSA